MSSVTFEGAPGYARDLRSELFQHFAIPDGAVADAERAGLELELLRRRAEGLTLHAREDLPPAGVHDRQCPGGAGREGVERRDPGDGHVQSEGQPARCGEAHAQAGEAAGAGSHHDTVQLERLHPGLAQQLVGVFEHPDGPGGALSEHLSVPDERGRGNARRGVKRECQHPRRGARAGRFPGSPA